MVLVVPSPRMSVLCCIGYMQVIKEEFSSSGLGVRVCRCLSDLACGTALERWVQSCLSRDGMVTVEPWLDILVEFSAECVKQSATFFIGDLFAYRSSAHYACEYLTLSSVCLGTGGWTGTGTVCQCNKLIICDIRDSGLVILCRSCRTSCIPLSSLSVVYSVR